MEKEVVTEAKAAKPLDAAVEHIDDTCSTAGERPV